MNEEDNVVQARFKPPSNLESMLDVLKEYSPDEVFCIAVKDGYPEMIYTTMSKEDAALIGLHVPMIHTHLMEYYHPLIEEGE